MSRWRKTTLGEVCILNPPKKEIGKFPPRDSVAFLPMQNIKENNPVLDLSLVRAYEDVSKSSYTYFKEGDVLLAKVTPCFENGKAGIANGLINEIGFGSSELHTIRCTPDIIPEYIYRVITQPHFKTWAMPMMTGTGGLRRVPQDTVSSYEFLLPPIKVQKQIVAILDTADTIRNKRKEAITKLDQLGKALFLEMFGDPVKNEKKWPLTTLPNLGTLDRGVSKHRPRNDPKLFGGKYPLVQTGEVSGCSGYIYNYHSMYSEIGLKQSKLWKKGTLCITIAANIAKTGILTFDACFPDSIVGFMSPNNATIDYVRYWFSFLQKYIEEKAPASAQKNINLGILRTLEIPNPPINLQEDFSIRIKQLIDLKIQNELALIKEEQLFLSLQLSVFRNGL